MALPDVKHPAGFPSCISLSIDFNEHATYYQTAEEWLQQLEELNPVQWVSENERQRALATDSIWVCRWHPITPVGSCEVLASSFETLMAYVNANAA